MTEAQNIANEKDKIIAWAKENYENSYGAQVIIECWGDEQFEGCSLKLAKEIACIHDEQNAAANMWVEGE